jgi:hypothetical protein
MYEVLRKFKHCFNTFYIIRAFSMYSIINIVGNNCFLRIETVWMLERLIR